MDDPDSTKWKGKLLSNHDRRSIDGRLRWLRPMIVVAQSGSRRWLHWSLPELGIPAALVGKTHRPFFLCSQSSAGSTLGPFLSSGDRPSQPAIARSIPQAWLSMTGGYGGQPAMWTSKADPSCGTQAPCEVTMLWRSVKRRCGEWGRKLGLELFFCKKLILVGPFYRYFSPCTRDGRGLKFNALSVLIRSRSGRGYARKGGFPPWCRVELGVSASAFALRWWRVSVGLAGLRARVGREAKLGGIRPKANRRVEKGFLIFKSSLNSKPIWIQIKFEFRRLLLAQ
jgi:hypothetical protein